MHPDSGTYWEEYCDAPLRKAGWHSVPEWPPVYWYPKLRLLLMVYVVDFQMSGPVPSPSMNGMIGSLGTLRPEADIVIEVAMSMIPESANRLTLVPAWGRFEPVAPV